MKSDAHMADESTLTKNGVWNLREAAKGTNMFDALTLQITSLKYFDNQADGKPPKIRARLALSDGVASVTAVVADASYKTIVSHKID